MFWLYLIIFGIFEAFVLLPAHGKYLEKKCKKNCKKCKLWHCGKWHKRNEFDKRRLRL